jgi:hypothetical protein
MTGRDLAKDATAFWKTQHGMAGMDSTGKRGGPGGGEFAKQANNWPTPTANDDNKSVEAHLAMKQRMGERDGSNANRTAITSLNVKVKQWTTPQAHDSSGGNPERVRRKGSEHGCANLADDVTKWKADE